MLGTGWAATIRCACSVRLRDTTHPCRKGCCRCDSEAKNFGEAAALPPTVRSLTSGAHSRNAMPPGQLPGARCESPGAACEARRRSSLALFVQAHHVDLCAGWTGGAALRRADRGLRRHDIARSPSFSRRSRCRPSSSRHSVRTRHDVRQPSSVCAMTWPEMPETPAPGHVEAPVIHRCSIGVA